jgi:AMP deaminase
MAVSRQRLGDDPRDHDGQFPGVAPALAAVSAVRPDADPAAVAALAAGVGVGAPAAEEGSAHKATPWKIYPPPPPPHWQWRPDAPAPAGTHPKPLRGGSEEFDFGACAIPGADADARTFELDDRGVYQVYAADVKEGQERTPLVEVPTIREYFMDLDYVLGVISDGPTKSFAYRRLKFLASKFTMYTLLNEFQETGDMKVRRRGVLDVRLKC